MPARPTAAEDRARIGRGDEDKGPRPQADAAAGRPGDPGDRRDRPAACHARPVRRIPRHPARQRERDAAKLGTGRPGPRHADVGRYADVPRLGRQDVHRRRGAAAGRFRQDRARRAARPISDRLSERGHGEGDDPPIAHPSRRHRRHRHPRARRHCQPGEGADCRRPGPAQRRPGAGLSAGEQGRLFQLRLRPARSGDRAGHRHRLSRFCPARACSSARE